MDKYFWLKILLNVFELTAFVAGMIYWKKIKHSYWKWFAIYCGVVFFVEMIGKYVGYVLKDPKLNSDIYFFFGIPIQFLFFFWLFYMLFEKKNDKLIPLLGYVFYVIAWAIELIFLREKRMWFSSFSYLAGNVLLFLLIIICFLRFINSNDVLRYKSSMFFWVGTGMLIFYMGTLPFYGLRNYWYYNYKAVFYPYWDSTYILGSIMYLFFAFAFIWGKPK